MTPGNWKPYPAEKPPRGGSYLVCFYPGVRQASTYNAAEDRWGQPNVRYWQYLPDAPDFTK